MPHDLIATRLGRGSDACDEAHPCADVMEAFDQHARKMAGSDTEVKQGRLPPSQYHSAGDLMPKKQTICGDELDLGAF